MPVELGRKSVTIPKAKLTILFFTVKNVIPATVKLGALKAGELLLWVWLARRAFFCCQISSQVMIFHQML